MQHVVLGYTPLENELVVFVFRMMKARGFSQFSRRMESGRGSSFPGRNFDKDDPDVCGRLAAGIVLLKCTDNCIHDAGADRYEGCTRSVGQVGMPSKLGVEPAACEPGPGWALA